MKLKNSIFYSDKTLSIIAILLSCFSGVMVYSSWSITTVVFGQSSPISIFGKQVFFLVLSFSLYYIILKVNYNIFRRAAGIILFSAIILLIIVLGTEPINDSTSWIQLGAFNFQPSEYAKIALIFWVAAHYNRLIKKEVKMDAVNWFVKPLVVVCIPLALIVIQPDPGTAIIIISFLMPMVFATGFKFRFLIKGLFKFAPAIVVILFVLIISNLVTSGGVVDSIVTSQQRMISRFDYKDPCEKYNDSGFQICNSLIAINSGGISGKGIGNSTQKYLYLPESHTDAIFAVTVEEHGFIAGVALLAMYFIIIYKILYYAKNTSSKFAMLVCIGIAFMYLSHIFVNIAGILNIIPFTGVPLPFYSYGGTFSLLCFGSLGVVQSIAIEHNRERVM